MECNLTTKQQIPKFKVLTEMYLISVVACYHAIIRPAPILTPPGGKPIYALICNGLAPCTLSLFSELRVT
jgi:hypothetical protein